MLVQLEEEALTSVTVWETVEDMICGRVLEARLGKVARVERQRDLWSVSWHAQWAVSRTCF